MTKLAVIIPVRNRYSNLKLVLSSLTAQTLPKEDWEVVVSDDNSNDKAWEIIESFRNQLNLKYVFNNVRFGSWNASTPRNLGVGVTSRGVETFVFNDSDVLLPHVALQHYLEDYQANPNRVVVGGYHWLKRTDFTEQQVVGSSITALCEPYVAQRDIRQASFDKGTENDTFDRVFDGLACFGGNIMFPKAIFAKVHGYDEETEIGLEDGEMGIRLWKAGVPISYDKRTFGFHMWHETPPDRFPPNMKDYIDKMNLKHFGTKEPDYGIIEASRDTYAQWGIPNWTPPPQWGL